MPSSTDMRIFVRIVERGSFSAAAEDLGFTPSAVSKLITRLEDRLGVRLFHRTTRKLALTPEGEIYHRRACNILATIEDAEAEVSRAGLEPRGRLRVSCVTAFAFHELAPALPDFVSRFPKVDVELATTDRVIDLLAENIDVGVRTGPVTDPSLVVRKITDVERSLFASPAYLSRRGTPEKPEQLCDHDCVVLSLIPSAHRWLFQQDGKAVGVDIMSSITVDSAEAALQVAIAGGGITRVGDMLVGQALRDGQLVPVLSSCHIAERVPLSAVYPAGRHRMPKVRAFLDFLVERFAHAPWRRSDDARPVARARALSRRAP